MLRDRGDDPDRLPAIYAEMINTAISGRPADMAITMHLCRGNFRSSWIAQGGYEPVAELLFNQIGVDGYFMEFDTERAGGFEPLRFVPKGKTVVLGIVTSKVGCSGICGRPAAPHRRRGASIVDLDQLCLSPQCGFASTEEGNALTEEEQWAKLARIVEVARRCGGMSVGGMTADRRGRTDRRQPLDVLSEAAHCCLRRSRSSSMASIFRCLRSRFLRS